MHKLLIASATAIALSFSGAAWAQQNATKNEAKAQTQPMQSGTQNDKHAAAIMTVSKLKQELQSAGFSDIKVVEDAFVVQAKTKEGNPILLSIGPTGMSALEVMGSNGAHQASSTSSGPQQSQASSGQAQK